MLRTGRCECGAVRYRSDGPWRDIITCHCKQCRRLSGHVWAATAVPVGALTFDHDTGLAWYRSSEIAERGFCTRCGSGLFYRPRGKGYIAVGAGTLDDATGLAHIEEVFAADKSDYYALAGDVPAHDRYSSAWVAKDGGAG